MDLSPYLSGAKLYGDDFSAPEIEAWHRDEREAYAGLAGGKGGYRYAYHALNARHGFRHLPDRSFQHVLGMGSAYGEELRPIAARIRRVTILEPSEAFARERVCGIPATYVRPDPSGDLPFPDRHFDLVTCLGVLHHLPNVSHVVAELFRCLSPGGFALIREPVVSMGDWSRPRRGLTPRERGIPLPLFREIHRKAGFECLAETLCMFPPIPRLWNRLGRAAYNDPVATRLDRLLCAAFRWNLRYHRANVFQKLGPTSVYAVLARPPAREG